MLQTTEILVVWVIKTESEVKIMNFTPAILTYISAWSKQSSLDVDVRLEFTGGSIRLIFSFVDVRLAKVWNKAYEPKYLNECNLTLYDLVKQTLEEAEQHFNEVR